MDHVARRLAIECVVGEGVRFLAGSPWSYCCNSSQNLSPARELSASTRLSHFGTDAPERNAIVVGW
jgi:hypothetical protein